MVLSFFVIFQWLLMMLINILQQFHTFPSLPLTCSLFSMSQIPSHLAYLTNYFSTISGRHHTCAWNSQARSFFELPQSTFLSCIFNTRVSLSQQKENFISSFSFTTRHEKRQLNGKRVEAEQIHMQHNNGFF